MTQQIKIPQFYPDALGNPAYQYVVYIGIANTDPTDPANQLTVLNGSGGSATSNPYFVTSYGYAKSSNDQRINPVIEEDSYSIRIESTNGAKLVEEAEMISDSPQPLIQIEAIVDGVVNNFAEALVTDFVDKDTIYIQAYRAGWEASAAGNIGDSFHYRTGNTGTPSSGNAGKWYDITGAEFKPFPSQRLYAEMFGAVTGSGNDSFQAIQDMMDAGLDLDRAIHCDDDGEYLIFTQSTAAPAGYSLFNFYGLSIPEGMDLRLGAYTKIKNNTQNSDQALMFAEDLTQFSITGGELDANASTLNSTMSLYIAGCSTVTLNTKISNSSDNFMSSSPTNTGGDINSDLLSFDTIFGHCFSADGGGWGNVNIDTVICSSCENGFNVTKNDPDGNNNIGISHIDIDTIQGSITDSIYTVTEGGIFTNNVSCDATDVYEVILGANNFDYTKHNTLSSTANTYNFVSSGGGVISEKVTSNPKPVLQEIYTTGTAQTHSIPNEVTRWKVTLTAGGGGDGGSGSNSTYTYNGVTLTASGGLSTTGATAATPDGGAATGGDINLRGQGGGATDGTAADGTGGNGGASFWGGGGSGSTSATGGTTTTYGAGAGGDESSNGASAGGTVIHWFERDITQATEPLYTVGSGGLRAGSGILLIEY